MAEPYWSVVGSVLRREVAIVLVAILVLIGCGGSKKGGDDSDDDSVRTFLSGRVLDTNAFAEDGTELPIVGVKVRFLDEDQVVETNADGEFRLRRLDAGVKVIDLDTSEATPAPSGDGYAGFREHIEVGEGANEVERPFYLPRIASDSLTTINPAVDTVVTNDVIGVSLTVAAGSARDPEGNLFTGQLSISEVPDGIAPAALPERFEPGLLFTIQPVGVTFSQPATLSIRNDRDAWPPGNEVDFWSLNPDTGMFEIVGVGIVSGDGLTIETLTGGVRAADWHFPTPASLFSFLFPPNNDIKCDGCCGGAGSAPGAVADGNGQGSTNSGTGTSRGGSQDRGGWASEIDFHNGRFREYITLPPYISQGKQRNLEFAYASDRAYPVEVMLVAPTVPSRAPVPDTISYRGFFGNVDQGYDFAVDTSGLDENVDETIRLALRLDGTDLPTGEYLGQARVSSNYVFTSVSSRFFEEFMVVNDIESEYGAGWRLMGLDRIYRSDSRGVVLVDGQGMPRRFTEATSTGSIVTIIADAPSFNDAFTWQEVLDEMGIPFQLRSVSGGTDPVLTMDDIEETSLFIWSVGNSFPYFGFAGDTVEERSNVLTVLEAAVTQGVPILAGHIDPSPRDTGFFINPACCVREPETSQQENLTGLRRSSNWESDEVPLGSQRLWQLLEPAHPIFNGPFGTIAPDPGAGVLGGLGTALNFAGNTVKPQLLGGDEIPLVRVYQDNGVTTSLSNLYPVVLNEHPPNGTPSLVIALNIGNDLPLDPFIATLVGNTLTWLLSGAAAQPGQLISPPGDSSILVRNEDGSYTRDTKDGYHYEFDEDGFMTSSTDRMGNTMTFSYSNSDRLRRVTDPVGKVTELEYEDGKLARVIDPVGRVTSFQHDAAGDLISVIFPDDSQRSFTYDARHLMSSQTNPRGFTSTYEYNIAGQATRATQADGSTRSLMSAQSVGLVAP